eukprot:1161042-Pelagomonas_calceolata.AAC.4
MVNRRQVGKQGSQCIAGWEACCPCMAYAPAQCHGRQSTSNPALGILSSEAIGRYTHLPNERRGTEAQPQKEGKQHSKKAQRHSDTQGIYRPAGRVVVQGSTICSWWHRGTATHKGSIDLQEGLLCKVQPSAPGGTEAQRHTRDL